MHKLSGRKQTKKHVLKRTRALIGRKLTRAHRKKLSIAAKNRPRGSKNGRPRNTAEVLWSKVDRRGPDECWPWKGSVNSAGGIAEPYGRTQINKKNYYAHRVIFDLVNPGLIRLSAPKKTDERGFVLHTCDNRLCCNPKHLWLGTNQDNVDDKIKKGRWKGRFPALTEGHA